MLFSNLIDRKPNEKRGKFVTPYFRQTTKIEEIAVRLNHQRVRYSYE